MLVLPRFIALESAVVEKFVYFLQEDDDGNHHGALIANGETILSPFAKFEVEAARAGSANHFNIRSCYNNKYWTLSSRRNEVMIACDAAKPQEDTSLRTCTLFEPVFINGDQNRKFVRFIFAFDGRSVSLNNTNQDPQNLLGLNSALLNRGLFTVSNWDLLYILPKHVTFKDDNGVFLSARTIEGYPYLQFDSDDIGDLTAGHEVSPLRDGAIRVKSNHFGRFWRRTPNWIWADSEDTTDSNLDTVFWPIKVSGNITALRNLGNDYFCKRLTTEGKTSCLSASVPTISEYAHLEVHETVLSRDISNVKFRLKDARIYGEIVILLATKEATNTSTEPKTITLKFSYSLTESKSFTSSVTLKLGVKTTIKAGIPFIESGEITITTEFEGEVEWGSTIETTKELETTYTVVVPPMAAMRVRLWATQGRCDVPFSYTQRDTLKTGQTITTILNDGVFTGVNYFNFRYEMDQWPLSNQFDEPQPLSGQGGHTSSLII